MAYSLLLKKNGSRSVVELPSGKDPQVLAEEHDAHYEGSRSTREEAETRKDELNEKDAPRWDS